MVCQNLRCLVSQIETLKTYSKHNIYCNIYNKTCQSSLLYVRQRYIHNPVKRLRKEVTLLELSIFKKSTIVDVFQSFLNTLNHKTIKLYKENTNSKMSYLSVLNYKERANQLTGIYMIATLGFNELITIILKDWVKVKRFHSSLATHVMHILSFTSLPHYKNCYFKLIFIVDIHYLDLISTNHMS